MRDHRISFLEPAAFFRWRTSQVVYFTVERKLSEVVESRLLPSSQSNQYSDYVMSGTNYPLSVTDDMAIPGEAHFFLPGDIPLPYCYFVRNNSCFLS
jgi:hypothetical protein